MTQDIFLLIQQDRQNLKDLTKDFNQADKDDRAKRSTDASNKVAMLVHGENAVIYPSLQENVEEGPALVEQSLKRLRSVVDDFDRLERMNFEDVMFPSFFDQTLDKFFDHWALEDRSLKLLRDAMHASEYEMLGPRWINARMEAPIRHLTETGASTLADASPTTSRSISSTAATAGSSSSVGTTETDKEKEMEMAVDKGKSKVAQIDDQPLFQPFLRHHRSTMSESLNQILDQAQMALDRLKQKNQGQGQGQPGMQTTTRDEHEHEQGHGHAKGKGPSMAHEAHAHPAPTPA